MNGALLISDQGSAAHHIKTDERTRGMVALPRVRFLYRFRVSLLRMRFEGGLREGPIRCHRFCVRLEELNAFVPRAAAASLGGLQVR